jgi:hypothetical protein
VVDLFRANIGIAAGWYKNMPYLVAKQGSILPASVGEFCYSSARIEQAHTIGIDTFYHGEDKLLFLSQERNMLPLPTRGHTRYKSMGWTYQTASDLDIDPAWERHVPTNSNDPITHVPVTNTELRDTMLLPTSHETVNELLVKKLAADIHAINVVSGDSYIGQQTITSVNSNVSNVKQSISTNDSKQKHFISTFTEMFDSIKKEDK